MIAHLVSWFGRAIHVNAAHDILDAPHGPTGYPHIHQIETEILASAVRALLSQTISSLRPLLNISVVAPRCLTRSR